MIRLRRARPAPPPPTRAEWATQVALGLAVGAIASFVGVLVLKGLAFGFVVLMIGLAFLARRRPRIGPFASGLAFAGIAAFLVLVLLIVLGHHVG